jgi:hypothetical protein
MALVSPGVQVSVIDESFYTPAEPGTVPMIFVVSGQDKTNGAGTGTATATTKANAGKPFLVTSQRELTDLFGDPSFQIDSNNNPVHGGELNEYGLQAAYSYLGVASRAFVVRADVDTGQLNPSADAPSANPADGTYWLDTQISRFGLFQWNGNAITTTGGQTFTNVVPTVITDKSKLVGGDVTGDPKPSVGAIGDYVLVATTTWNRLYYKNGDNAWVKVGSAAWKNSWETIQGSVASNAASFNQSDSITLNGETITFSDASPTLTNIIGYINAVTNTTGVTAKIEDNKLTLYSNGSYEKTGTLANIDIGNGTGTPLATLGITAGEYFAPALSIAPHTSVPEFKTTDTKTRPTGSVWFKTTDPNLGAKVRVKVWNDTTKLWVDSPVPMYADNNVALNTMDKTGGGQNLAVGTLYAQTNISEDSTNLFDFKIYRRTSAGPTTITSSAVTAGMFGAGAHQFGIAETVIASSSLSATKTVNVTLDGTTGDAETIAEGINGAGLVNVSASVDAQNRVVIAHAKAGDFRLINTASFLTTLGFSAFVDSNSGTPNLYAAPSGDSTFDFVASNWKVLSYTASEDAPNALATNGTLWYNSIVDEVDIMIHNGSTWVGYQDATSPVYNADAAQKTDPAGPIVSATEPTKQSDGTDLKTGDLWIDTADIENYPTIYKYNASTAKWNLVDKGDQTTEDGILFADARYGTTGANSGTAATIADLMASNFLDFDAPDPALYPKGMLLWNLRRSGFNVKKFVRNYINTANDNERFNDESMDAYYTHRWVTESANQEDGSGTFGRKAQRKVVVQALQALVNSNQDIRDDESRLFNVMATPNYPELIGEMIALNNDRGLTAFIVGDSPMRLTPDATTINEWGNNVNLAVEDNDNGLVSRDEYLGVFYPSLFTSDNAGNNVVVPASHGILRTLALSDQVSFPWFAPAGTRRGGISNASAAGYIDSEGEFVSVALNEGQRDTLYSLNINPITFLTGAGLVNFGQKTRARNASALDRINVARLVIFLRSQLNKLAKPFIFEPNDKITRDEMKQQVDALLLELVGQRALYDFLVVCDESNNTPNRIDRNELHVDIAIEPVKAVEFIYIPLRLKNTGEIAGL